MNKETLDLLKQEFSCPAPKRKMHFLETLRPRKITMADFVIMQVAYIRKAVWVLTFIIFGTAVICAWRGSDNTERMIAALLPFIAAAAVIETQRSASCQMTEIEAATRFSLRRIFFAKMLIMGGIFLGLFVVVTPIIAVTLKTSLIITAAHILIPYLITMIICLSLERTNPGRSNRYLSIAAATGVSICVLMAGEHIVMMTTNMSSYLFILLTILLLLVTAIECRKTINKMEAFA